MVSFWNRCCDLVIKWIGGKRMFIVLYVVIYYFDWFWNMWFLVMEVEIYYDDGEEGW